jgi:anaerobic dimethyl sulfoxide reductase subunit A
MTNCSENSADRTIPVSCDRDCGGGCPLLATVRNGRVRKIVDNPLGGDHLRGCIKGYRLMETTYAPDRIVTPLLRTGDRGEGQFKAITWPEALDRVAEKLAEIKQNHGSMCVLPFSGSGSCRAAVHNTSQLTRRFFSLFGGFVDRRDSYSSAAADYTAKHLFGTTHVGVDPETLEKSRLIVLWGANVCSARLFSSRWAPLIAKARSNGARVAVVDPRRSRTVRKLADQWICLRPGTDSALMAAVLYVIISEKRLDHTFVDTYTTGFAELTDYIMGRSDQRSKTPGWAAEICGVAESTITELARHYGSIKPAALLPGLSIQRVLGGEQNYRFAVALQAATGNIGLMGGASGAAPYKLPGPRFPTIPVPNLRPLPAIPVYLWTDLVLKGVAAGHPAKIKAIYSVGANFLNQGSDITRNMRAFETVDFVVTQDLFMTPTARFSDIILPATTSLEREDVITGGDNRLFYSQRAIDPVDGTRHDYDIFTSLARRLGFGDRFSEGRTTGQWLDFLMAQSEVDDIDQFKRSGIYRGPDQQRIGLRAFIQNPLQNPLNTPSGKIEIRSQGFAAAGGTATPEVFMAQPDKSYPLTLITPHCHYRINSQNSNLRWAKHLIDITLTMNQADGQRRGLTSGDRVRVRSAQGEMEITVTLDKHMAPGCVTLFQGGWTTRDKYGVEIGGSANSLSSALPTYPSQGSRTHSIYVEVGALKHGRCLVRRR